MTQNRSDGQTVELSVEERVEGLLILDNEQYDEFIVYDPVRDYVVDRFSYDCIVIYNGMSTRQTRQSQRKSAIQFAKWWSGGDSSFVSKGEI